MLLTTLLLLALAVANANSQAFSQKQQMYAVTQTFVLNRKPNGVVGRLQLLMDKRLTASVRKELCGKGGWFLSLSSNSLLYRELLALPPRKSKLEITCVNGKLIAELNLERPLARLQAWSAGSSTNEFFLLTEDYSAAFGSYNGPETTLLKIVNANFHELMALNVKSHKEEPFRLMKSLKSTWRITRRSPKGEILSVSCYPKADGKFVIDYVRYSFNGTKWLAYKRQVNGYWESDETFPKRSPFP
ncbi:MAG: hypothetical protein ACRD4O_17025 [Bryobacteraceae bacterium]